MVFTRCSLKKNSRINQGLRKVSLSRLLYTEEFMAAYQLTEADLDVFDDDPPSIRAARNSNPLVLSAILSEGTWQANNLEQNAPPRHLAYIIRNFTANSYVTGAIHCIYDSPLVAAINAMLPQNVATLLVSWRRSQWYHYQRSG